MSNISFRTGLSSLLLVASVVALCVVMLGAYTRLTDAGLGCPDWPGCYGHIVLPSNSAELRFAQQSFPSTPIESIKAWTEMSHRYAAGLLALLVAVSCGTILWQRFRRPYPPESPSWTLALTLIALVLFQACLGMWTVTLKLLPAVVMAHLLGGILIFSCLSLLYIQQKIPIRVRQKKLYVYVAGGAVLVLLQIALGGWVSANYAGIACLGFPGCNGHGLPRLHFSEGFNLFSNLGDNYQGGVLDSSVRMSIQMVHRIGALVVAVYLVFLSVLVALKSDSVYLKNSAFFALLLLFCQICLGVANVVYLLPLPIAVAHNGVAALLMATLLCMTYFAKGTR